MNVLLWTPVELRLSLATLWKRFGQSFHFISGDKFSSIFLLKCIKLTWFSRLTFFLKNFGHFEQWKSFFAWLKSTRASQTCYFEPFLQNFWFHHLPGRKVLKTCVIRCSYWQDQTRVLIQTTFLNRKLHRLLNVMGYWYWQDQTRFFSFFFHSMWIHLIQIQS